MIVFPRVLAIEDDGHQGIAAGGQDAGAVLADAVQEIGGGMRGLHLGIDEADQVAHEMIAEDQPHGAALLAPLVGTVQAFHRHGALLGAVEHAAIGGGPFETQFAGQSEDFVRNRALGGPETDRRDTEVLLDVFARQFELAARVAGIAEARRQRHVGVRHAGDVGIAEQRQDGMVVRRGGNFDLAGSGEPGVLRQHAADNLALLFAHAALVIQGEIAAALDPLAHLRVIGLKLFVEPGELRPHLHIAQFLGAEHGARTGCLLRVARVEELAVARVAVDHVRRIGIERVLQEQLALFFGQVLGGLEGEGEERIARLRRRHTLPPAPSWRARG